MLKDLFVRLQSVPDIRVRDVWPACVEFALSCVLLRLSEFILVSVSSFVRVLLASCLLVSVSVSSPSLVDTVFCCG